MSYYGEMIPETSCGVGKIKHSIFLSRKKDRKHASETKWALISSRKCLEQTNFKSTVHPLKKWTSFDCRVVFFYFLLVTRCMGSQYADGTSCSNRMFEMFSSRILKFCEEHLKWKSHCVTQLVAGECTKKNYDLLIELEIT